MKVSKVRKVRTPQRANKNDAGIDFFVPDDFNNGKIHYLDPGESILIPSGIHVNVPDDHALIAFNKSGVAVKKTLLAGAAVVDEGYQGEMHIHIINVGLTERPITPGEKIMQFILLPMFYDMVEEVEFEDLYLEDSTRGSGGFGSTGA
jgi:dUTP pyrophosphatase